jgi:hypothetical protein
VTFCSWTTWVSYQTWVLATLTDARLISSTFRIWCAFRLRWNCFKILQLLISNICLKNPYIIKKAGRVEFANVVLCLIFSTWPFKCQFFAMARGTFNLNVCCETMFFLLGNKDVPLMVKYYPIWSLKINPSTVRCVLWRPAIGFCSGLQNSYLQMF